MKKSNSLSTKGQFTQENVPQLIEKINDELKALKANDSDKQTITAELEHFGRIDKINTVSTLIMAHSSLTNREKFYKESAAELLKGTDVKVAPFKVNGHTVDEWVEEIQDRVIYLAHKKKVDKLKKAKAELEKHLSEEMKFQKTISGIVDIFEDKTVE